MTVAYLTERNTKCYRVTFKIECVKVQKFEDISNEENTILNIKRMETFLGKSQACDMTAMSGAFDKSFFNGNTILLKISEENDRHRYVYIGGNMVCSFLTNDLGSGAGRVGPPPAYSARRPLFLIFGPLLSLNYDAYIQTNRGLAN